MDAKGKRVVVGLSGGRDSVALLHWLVVGGYDVEAVYVDHGLQEVGREWGVFCGEYCEQLGVSFRVVEVEVDIGGGVGLEAAAREVRYGVLMGIAREVGGVLAVGHHRDDNEETMLYQLFRGTGLRGLRGMVEWREMGGVWVWRPLLGWLRDDVSRYCEQFGLKWVEDPTNGDGDRYSRNYVRGLLPQLRERFSTMRTSLSRMSHVVDETLLLLDEVAEEDLLSSSVEVLNTKSLSGLSERRKRNAWRYWMDRRLPGFCVEERTLREWMRQVETLGPKVWQLRGVKFEYKKGEVRVVS